MATLSSPVLLAFLLFALFLVVRRVVPLISNLFSSNVKLRTISPRSIRGLEWSRITSISGKPVKLLVRVERIRLTFHALPHPTKSWIILSLDDVSLDLSPSPTPPPPSAEPSSSQVSSSSKSTIQSLRDRLYGLSPRLFFQLVSLTEKAVRQLCRRLPSLARLLSVEINGRSGIKVQPGVLKVGGSSEGARLGGKVALKGELRIGAKAEVHQSSHGRETSASEEEDGERPKGLERSRRFSMKVRALSSRWMEGVVRRGLGRSAGVLSVALELSKDARVDLDVIQEEQKKEESISPTDSSTHSPYPSSSNSPRSSVQPLPSTPLSAKIRSRFSSRMSSSSTPSPSGLLFISGPLRLEAGHRFGPSVAVLGESSLSFDAELEGEIVASASRLKRLKEQLDSLKPHPEPLRERPPDKPPLPQKLRPLHAIHFHFPRIFLQDVLQLPSLSRDPNNSLLSPSLSLALSGLDVRIQSSTIAQCTHLRSHLGSSSAPAISTALCLASFEVLAQSERLLLFERFSLAIDSTHPSHLTATSTIIPPRDPLSDDMVSCQISVDSFHSDLSLDALRNLSEKISKPHSQSSPSSTRLRSPFYRQPPLHPSDDDEPSPPYGILPWTPPRFVFSAELGPSSFKLTAENVDQSGSSPRLVVELPGGLVVLKGEYRNSNLSLIKADTRLTMSQIEALLPLDTVFNVDLSGGLHPLSVTIDAGEGSERMELFEMEEIELEAQGKIMGRRTDTPASIALETKTVAVDANLVLGCVRVELWRPVLIDGVCVLLREVQELVARRKAAKNSEDYCPAPSEPLSDSPDDPHQTLPRARHFPSQPDPEPTPSVARRLLAHLPPSFNFHSSVPSVDVILASVDPKVDENLTAIRGLWIRTRFILEGCQSKSRNDFNFPVRTSRLRRALQLPRDISSEAAALTNELRALEQDVALFRFKGHQAAVRPLFQARSRPWEGINSTEFRLYSNLFPPSKPKRKVKPFSGWEYQREDEKPGSPFALSEAQKASSPLRLEEISVRLTLYPAAGPSTDIQSRLVVELNHIEARLDLSHVYCALLAAQIPKRLQSAVAKSHPPLSSPPPRKPSKPRTLDIVISVGTVYLCLDLSEIVFLRLRSLNCHIPASGEDRLKIDSFLAYVPSPYSGDSVWEELLSLRQIVAETPNHDTQSVSIRFRSARLRIPYTYRLSQLILTINITIKAIKGLPQLLLHPEKPLVVAPTAKEAKTLPFPVQISIDTFTFEAKDDPLETRLNLIWRAGLEEQRARLERDEAFEAKVAVIEETEGKRATPKDDLPRTTPASRWNFGSKHTVSAENARHRLQVFNASSWTRRLRAALAEQRRREDRELARAARVSVPDPRLPIQLLPPARSAPLFRMSFFGWSVRLSPPSFPLEETPAFLEEQGNMPRSTEFSLLVPIHIRWTLDGARVNLRDYPLPLFNLPPLTPEQLKESPGLKAYVFETDLAIGEELAGPDSSFWIPVEIYPPQVGENGNPGLSVKIGKTIMPVKTYARPKINFNTTGTTDWCWGSSLQPAIQDMMKVFETLSHPPRDPSERLGFWDKIRLVLHWKVEMLFEGPIHMHFKGSRSPYEILQTGAGFVLGWSGKPRWVIGHPNEERELIQISAERLVFAIPDLRNRVDERAMGSTLPVGQEPDEDGTGDSRGFQKICAKFTNGARVGWGFVLERTCVDAECTAGCSGSNFHRACRFFDFKPHYDVTLRTPESLKEQNALKDDYDAYKSFRSNFIHFSMSVVSPTQTRTPRSSVEGYNAFHFTPKGFAHFFAWWKLFGGNMALPIRQGELWKGSPPPSKKFGKAIATIKYRLDLAPLFISHMYSDDSEEDWARGEGTYLGLKTRISHFTADLHQREQERTVTNEKLNRTKRIPHKPFYAIDVVLDDLDLRATSVVFSEPEKSHIDLDPTLAQDASHFNRPTELPDMSWWDYDDHVETDWAPVDPEPLLVEMHQVASVPRFQFTKRTGSSNVPRDGDSKEGEEDIAEASKFGHEGTHACVLGHGRSPLQIQLDVAYQRTDLLRRRLENLTAPTGSTAQIPLDQNASAEQSIRKKLALVESHIANLRRKIESDETHQARDGKPSFDEWTARNATASNEETILKSARFATGRGGADGFKGGFDSVYQATHPRLTWSNEGRNLVLKYYYLSRIRKGFEWHMSAAATKYIETLTTGRPTDGEQEAKEQSPPKKKSSSQSNGSKSSSSQQPETNSSSPDAPPTSSAIKKSGNAIAASLLSMFTGEPVVAESEETTSTTDPDSHQRYKLAQSGEPFSSDPWDSLSHSESFAIERSHCLILIRPQIVLRSNLEGDSIIILAADSFEFQSFSVLDREDLDDPVNSTVLRRSYSNMTSLQAFYPSSLNASSKDGGSDFVPLEILLDDRSESNDFARIVPQTDCQIQYDKFNQLRIRNRMQTEITASKAATNEHLRAKMDLVRVHVPRFTVTATSAQFASLYTVVTDLLLYQDSSQQAKQKRLEAFIFSFDHSNLAGSSELISDIQSQIRALERLRATYEVNPSFMNTEGRILLAIVKGQMRQLAEELDLVFDAVASAQDPREERETGKKSAFKFEASSSEISWRMLTSEAHLLAKLAIKGSSLTWLARVDGSVANTLSIEDLLALNGHHDAVFPEIISKSLNASSGPKSAFAVLKWSLLAPVGGIAIVNYFGLVVHPLRLQLERKIGRDVLNYFFSKDSSKNDDKSLASTAYGPHHPHPGEASSSSSTVTTRANTPTSFKSSSTTGSRTSLHSTLDGSNASTDELGRLSQSSNRRPDGSSVSLSRTNSSSGLSAPDSSQQHNNKLKRSKSSASLRPRATEIEEMRARSKNRSFVYVSIAGLAITLSYKGDKARSLTDLRDVSFNAPNFELHDVTYSLEDLIHELKREVIRSLWAQKSHLVNQIFKGRPTSNKLHQLPANSSSKSIDSSKKPASGLRYSIQPPTPVGSSDHVDSSADSDDVSTVHGHNSGRITGPLKSLFGRKKNTSSTNGHDVSPDEAKLLGASLPRQ